MLKIVLLSLLVVIVAGVGVILLSTWRFNHAIGDEVRRLIAEAKPAGKVITAEMLAGLPPPAQRYLASSGVVGTAIPSVIGLNQRGRIRGDAQSAWMDLRSEEFYSTNPPAFIWKAYFPRPNLPVVFGRDEYLDGKGSILMKMLGVYAVADESGDELSAAGLMRYFNEMMWFPAAFLGDNVTIAPVDDSSFQATIADRGMTASATLFVDGDGRLTNFRALRFNTKTRSLETWETPITRHGELAGLVLPIAGGAVWKLKEADFDYVELEVTEVAYDEALPR